ncbi:peptide/nickel transport system permease protein [Enhydrobacter aerosaccus]|uniref:Peptide/nickel transport system permease protein n=1 Tax=Enhydrobacter aerosaccus TaxID=225324 RepID=A0A1T4QE19_9HYPH|nr:ABC transporter permease [Enhydrobacter aerosaccus]SKA01876.1 peptide/nickel transport system permease protein [Enhydrobacter aerosaccus]
MAGQLSGAVSTRSSSRRAATLRLLRRRLIQAVPLMLGVVVINFVLIHLAPGNFLDVMTAENQVSDPATVELLRRTYGLDDPTWLQLVKYVWALLHLDFGFSYRQNMPVLQAIWVGLPATLLLMLSSITLAFAVGVSAGVVASTKVRTLWDTVVSVAAMFFFAAPSFWLGIMMIVLFAVKLGWLPVGGMATIGGGGGLLDILHHLILPTLALGLFYAAIYARVMRASMLEVAQLDFVRTARAKGLSRTRVTLSHVLRNALLPVVTILGVQMGTILAGSVVIESVFSWPGIGSLLFDSVSSRNYPVVLGIMVLGSLVVIAANIAVDLVYMWLDPRIEIR